MPKTKPANPGQLRVRIKWYVSRQSNFSALSLTNSNCPDRTRIWRGLLLITDQNFPFVSLLSHPNVLRKCLSYFLARPLSALHQAQRCAHGFTQSRTFEPFFATFIGQGFQLRIDRFG